MKILNIKTKKNTQTTSNYYKNYTYKNEGPTKDQQISLIQMLNKPKYKSLN